MLKGARQAKESWVREVKGAEGMTDLPWTVHFRRGAEPIAMVYFNGNRDTMFGIARMGTIGFEADVLGVMNESYHSTSDTNPLTGDPWAPGEMQVLAEQHDGLANGWVREALTLLACNRAGDVKTMWLPYAIKGRAVEWGEVFGLDLEVGGYVPDTLRDTMMHAPPRPPWLNDAYAEHGYEDARAQQDAATVRLSSSACCLTYSRTLSWTT